MAAEPGSNNLQSLNGLFKETYADKLKELIPDGVKLINKIKFMSKDKQPGNLYHQPVILGQEHGVTFASSDDDAFQLEAAVAGVIKDATIKGNPVVMRSLLGYVAASRAMQGDKQSFQDATKFLVANMLRSMAKKLEVQMLYGQKSYGAIETALDGAGAPAVSGTVLRIKASEWAPGIWSGAEGMPIEVRTFEAAGDTPGSSSNVADVTVTKVDLSNRTITISSSITPSAVVDEEDVIFHKSAFGNEFPGIHKILTQTSGTLFGINVGDYDLFKGNQYSADSASLSFTKLNLAAARGVEKGQDGKLLALCNPRGWADMLSDQAALRQYDGSYSSAQLEQGSRAIKFFSQNGEIEVEPSIYVKEGYCYLLSLEEWYRVGSTDMTFKRPGQGEEFFRDLENAAAYELRLYSDQAVFCCAPGRNTIITDIVNSDDL
jgi:hypothetical protein